MESRRLIFLFILVFVSFQSNSEPNTISSKDASFNIGKNVIACGHIKEISSFSKGTYLNYDNKYPNQSLTVVIFDDRLSSVIQHVGNVDNLLNKQVCAAGKVSEYRGRHQIVLNNGYSIKLKE
jgi:hypothetical protein